MGLLVLAYLGGVLTILSPCILPVLPFVFARADKPFVRSGLPLLVGMALTFALVASLTTAAGSWAVHADQAGRILAMVLLTLFGLMLLFPSLSDHITRPLVALGSRLSNTANETDSDIGASLLLGVATGLLWAPCGGPILGLIFTGAAINGANASTALLLTAYAAGAATSLAAALLIGGRLFAAMKRSLGAGEWIRRGLGVLVLVGVVAIAFGADTGVLTQLSLSSTTTWEQALLDRAGLVHKTQSVAVRGSTLPVEGQLPPLTGATLWINSPLLTREQLRGKVVLVDFWTYSCINCLRTLPYINAWAAKYKDHGLVVLGVHSPEFAFEKDEANVRRAVKDLGITYPVAMDNDLNIWQAFSNQYWPAHYFIDAKGRVRAHQFGEGDYAHSEQIIQQLLTEAGFKDVPGGIVNPSAHGAEAAADINNMQSPETYIGYDKSQNFMSMPYTDEPHRYVAKGPFGPDQWNLNGLWTLHNEKATLDEAGGGIVFHFHARDLHLVMAITGKPVHFRVTLDGKPPGAAHGTDIDADGNGVVDSQRLYQLIRQSGGTIGDHMFEISFSDPGVEAFAFTFG